MDDDLLPAREFAYASEDQRVLNTGLREQGYYPESDYPADVFIAELAGLPIKEIPVDDAFETGGYWKYVFWEGADNTRQKVLIQGKAARMYMPYTPEQMKVIHQHWHLLSEQVKQADFKNGQYAPDQDPYRTIAPTQYTEWNFEDLF